MTKGDETPPRAGSADARKTRVADALRANLRRRKAAKAGAQDASPGREAEDER